MKKPTFKQKGFVKELVANGGNATKAAEKVYNVTTVGSAQSIGAENLTKPTVLQERDRILKEGNVTLERIATAHGELLKSDNENAKGRAVDMGYKLLDAYPSQRNGGSRHAHLHLHQEMLRDLEELPEEELEAIIEAEKSGSVSPAAV